MSKTSAKLNKLGFEINDKFFQARSVKEIVIKLLKELSKADKKFLDRYIALPKHGRTRRFVAKDKNELYPSRPDLVKDHSDHIERGYWVGTNVGKQQALKIIKLACQVSDLTYGKQVKVFF